MFLIRISCIFNVETNGDEQMTLITIENHKPQFASNLSTQAIQSICKQTSAVVEIAKAAIASFVRTPNIVPKEWYL
jgi:hypothetical protein